MKLALVSLNRSGSEDMLPLGLITLASYLKKSLDFLEVKIVDSNIEKDIFSKIKEIKPEVVGISAMTIDYNSAIKLAERIKSELKSKIIVGGVHISTLPDSLKKCFDIGVVGEGERTMKELLQKNLKNLEKIKGIIFYKNNKLIINPARELIEDLDEIPIPDRSLVDKSYFKETLSPSGKKTIRTSMLTSRGCPYKCVFCSTSHFWKITRFHSVERMIEEIKELNERFDVNHFTLWDDLFAVNKKRLREFANKLEETGLINKITFSCQSRTNVFDDGLCELLKKINVIDVGFGFESGNEKVLNYLKAGSAKLRDHTRAIKLCKKYDISLTGSLIFGSPGETIEDMRDTLKLIDFMIKEDVENIWSFVMTPFPGTKIWEVAKKRERVSEDMDWDLLSHQNIDNPLVLDENINKEEFKKIFLEAKEKLKYFRRKKVMRDVKNNFPLFVKKILLNPRRAILVAFNKHIKK